MESIVLNHWDVSAPELTERLLNFRSTLSALPLFSETTHSNSLTAFTYSRILSTMATPIKTIKNLANSSSLKTDLRDYLNWLNSNYGISRTTSVIPSMTKPPIADPFSRNTRKNDRWTPVVIPDRVHTMFKCTLPTQFDLRGEIRAFVPMRLFADVHWHLLWNR